MEPQRGHLVSVSLGFFNCKALPNLQGCVKGHADKLQESTLQALHHLPNIRSATLPLLLKSVVLYPRGHLSMPEDIFIVTPGVCHLHLVVEYLHFHKN